MSSGRRSPDRTIGIVTIKEIGRKLLMSQYLILIITVLYFLTVWLFFVPRLGSSRNIQNILLNSLPLFAVAMGQTFVLIVAGIDLSQTSIMAASSVIGALFITTGADAALFAKSPFWGTLLTEQGGVLSGVAGAVPLTIIIMLTVGAVIGLINGYLTAHIKMPSFIVTLVSMMFFSALAIYIPKSENIMNIPQGFIALSKGSTLGIANSFITVVVLAGIAFILLERTRLGRWMYMVGTNPKAARISGIPVVRVIIIAFVLSGIFAAVSSVLYTGRLEAGRPTMGATILLDIVGANIISGASLGGGKGRVHWTFFGVLFYAVLANTLSLMNFDVFTIDVVKGVIILLAAYLDGIRSRISQTELR